MFVRGVEARQADHTRDGGGAQEDHQGGCGRRDADPLAQDEDAEGHGHDGTGDGHRADHDLGRAGRVALLHVPAGGDGAHDERDEDAEDGRRVGPGLGLHVLPDRLHHGRLEAVEQRPAGGPEQAPPRERPLGPERGEQGCDGVHDERADDHLAHHEVGLRGRVDAGDEGEGQRGGDGDHDGQLRARRHPRAGGAGGQQHRPREGQQAEGLDDRQRAEEQRRHLQDGRDPQQHQPEQPPRLAHGREEGAEAHLLLLRVAGQLGVDGVVLQVCGQGEAERADEHQADGQGDVLRHVHLR